LWNLGNSSPTPVILRGHEGNVLSIAFSPDGQTLASASIDGTVRLWDVDQSDAEPIVLRDHEGPVFSVVYSPNGQTLASAGIDQTVRLWIAQTGRLAKLACDQVRRNLTAQEWRQFLGEQPYRRTCRNWPIHPSVLEAARELARQGQVEAAIAQLRFLLTVQPTLRYDPGTEAQQALQEVIQKLLDEGRTLARMGDVEQATTKFQQAVKLDPGLNLDPQAEAERLALHTAANLVDEGKELARQDRLEEALAKFQEAEALDPNFKIGADEWHALCREGSQQGQAGAQAVLPACDRAVELNPDSSLFHSSRGLVRSMTGDQAGTLEDFKFVREQLQQNGGKP
jgi:tetratricopeptide (TPR) repeat protein